MRFRLLDLLIVCWCLLYAHLLSIPLLADTVLDYSLAVVNGHMLTRSALDTEIDLRRLDEVDDVMRQQILREIIERQLLLEEAHRWGIDLMRWHSRAVVEVQNYQNEFPSEADYASYLQERGLDSQDVEEWLTDRLIAAEYIRRQWEEPLRMERDQKAVSSGVNNSLTHLPLFPSPPHLRSTQPEDRQIQEQVTQQMHLWLAKRWAEAKIQILDDAMRGALHSPGVESTK